jgi:hypothetical protein
MSYFCFSSASILRCDGDDIDQLKAKLLIIPPALQLLFATLLVFAKWGDGTK